MTDGPLAGFGVVAAGGSRGIGEAVSTTITGQFLSAAGLFVGRFDGPSPTLPGYLDHYDAPPWSLDEIAAMLT